MNRSTFSGHPARRQVRFWINLLIGLVLAGGFLVKIIAIIQTSERTLSEIISFSPTCNSKGIEALSTNFEPFGVVTIQPDFEVNGQGSNIDSIAFWEAPDPADTLMFVTAKSNQLVERWQYPFVNHELAPLMHSSFGSDAQVTGWSWTKRAIVSTFQFLSQLQQSASFRSRSYNLWGSLLLGPST